MAAGDVHAVAHITGGGLSGNLPRVLPDDARAVVDRSAWTVPPIFGEIRRLGPVSDEEMASVFNLGVGMVVVVPVDGVDGALSALGGAGVTAVPVGHVEAGERGIELVGAARWASAEARQPRSA